ncbi:hypothetical protein RJ639_008398 [Escallonia herrerae]|uniref:Uncharacterized protein n=1 Tax=Escallonia herrerae TaxID=1293975 RepID=A0AA89AUI6_9ASTE|nr:hypothetical protein RJ639_008398 [Escallonia herrerae]
MADKPQPVQVLYCEICGLPPEYCEFGPDFEKCKPWLIKNAPDVYPDLIKEASDKVTDQLQSSSISDGTAPSGEDLRMKLLYLENRVGLAKLLFPVEAKVAMDIAQVDGTSEFPLAGINSKYTGDTRRTKVDLNEAPFKMKEEHLSRLQALSKTVELGKRFFPRCSDVLNKIMDADDLSELAYLGNDGPDERQLKKQRYIELQEVLSKAFSEDKEEFHRSNNLSPRRHRHPQAWERLMAAYGSFLPFLLSIASSSSFTVIPQLHHYSTIKLTNNNYLLWQTQLLPILRSNNLYGLVDGTESCPPAEIATPGTTTRTPNPDYKHWVDRDQLVLRWINTSLSEAVLSIIVGHNTSASAWRAISNAFGASSHTHILQLLMQLHNTKHDDKPVATYLQELKYLADHCFQ